jgi:Zn-dependent peptidase ImmA (M78 family)
VTNSDKPESAIDIEKIGRILLKESKAFGVFPTPVDKIIECAELKLAQNIDLSKVDEGFFSKKLDALQTALRKVRGLLDRRQKTIYLDLSQAVRRQRFVKLHEVGHEVCPWQNAYPTHPDDDRNLDPDIKELYEREASFFASFVLFQGERFDEEAKKLPLSLGSAMALAKKFESSNQAAIRRYVEYSKKRCAVLVLNPLVAGQAEVRNFFFSKSFRSQFGLLTWPPVCTEEFSFMKDLRYRKFHQDGKYETTDAALNPLALQYHFFNSSHNSFFFFIPSGEENISKTKIIISSRE